MSFYTESSPSRSNRWRPEDDPVYRSARDRIEDALVDGVPPSSEDIRFVADYCRENNLLVEPDVVDDLNLNEPIQTMEE